MRRHSLEEINEMMEGIFVIVMEIFGAVAVAAFVILICVMVYRFATGTL